MDKQSASRIQSSQEKSGQYTGKGSFSSRSQSAADRNTNTQGGQQQGGQQQGNTQGSGGKK